MKRINKTKIIFATSALFLFFFIIYSLLFSGFANADATDEETITITATVAPNSTAVFSGLACPLCRVYVEIGGVVEESGLAQNDATFQVAVGDLATGTYLFDVYARDTEGVQSSTSSFTIAVSQGTITSVSGILLSPTLDSNKSEAVIGAGITFFGQTVPNSVVTILIDGNSPFIQVNSEADGGFYYIFDTASLILGNHTAEARVISGGNTSDYSPQVDFRIVVAASEDEEEEEEDGDEDEEEVKKEKCVKADYDNNHKVDLVDFSILIYWYEKSDIPNKNDLNDDKKADLKDFSILMYCWDG